MPGHQESQTSRSFSYFRGGPCFSPTWVGLFLLPLRHLPRLGYEQPLILPLPFPATERIPEAVQRVGTSASQSTARQRGSLKHPRRPQSTPAPTSILTDTAARLPWQYDLPYQELGSGRGASLQIPRTRVQADQALGRRRAPRSSQRNDQGPLPKARAVRKGAERAGASSHRPGSAPSGPACAVRSGDPRPHFLVCELAPTPQPRRVILGTRSMEQLLGH